MADARAKGMTPVLCSPIPHCPQKPVEAGAAEPSGYVAWSAEVAGNEKALFVDLNRIALSHYVGMTPEQVKARYFTPADNTHTSAEGAELNAACVVEGLRDLKDFPLAKYLRDKPAPTSAPAGTGDAVKQ